MIYVSALLDQEMNVDFINNINNINNKNIVIFVTKNIVNPNVNPNVKIIRYELEELETYKDSMAVEELPLVNDTTKNELIFKNAKIEFIKKAMDVVKSSHYTWIDIEDIESINLANLAKGLFIPGKWEKFKLNSYIYEEINHRFCGHFLMGDKESLLNMYNLYRKEYKNIIRYNLLWEVNVWAILEMDYGLDVNWIRC